VVPDDRGRAGLDLEIVGVVSDQKSLDIRETNPKIFFLPASQELEPRPLRRYVLRSTESPSQSIAAVTATVAAFDPTATIRYALLDTQVAEAMLQERLMARLSASFGGVALILAIVGLYGVVSYSVASRRAEIGVRVALGASRQRILSMILRDVGRIMAIGIVAGGVLALAAGRGIGSLLFGLSPNDMTTLAIAAALLVIAGFLSAAWPAKRAAGLDPVSALRES
jgi:putative ABC transport system permease protein